MQGRKHSKDEARQKIMSYCAMQERCHFEVQEKLKSWHIPYSIAVDLISHLIEYNFLNEERFARSFARGKFQLKRWGRFKIKQKLFEKRVSKPCIKLGLTEISDKDYKTAIAELIIKKEKYIIAENKFEREAKLKNYLLQKGYEWQDIREHFSKEHD